MEKPEILYLSQAEVASVNLPMAEILKALERLSARRGKARRRCPEAGDPSGWRG